jgi:cytidine deaminase
LAIRYLMWYRKIDKKAQSLPEYHQNIIDTYTSEIVNTYKTRMSQVVESAFLYKTWKKYANIVQSIAKSKRVSIVAWPVKISWDIGVKFWWRTISLENYTKMITNTAEQTAFNKGILNKGIQEWIWIYERVESDDKRTCPICRDRAWERWNVILQWMPQELFHVGCRGFWIPYSKMVV